MNSSQETLERFVRESPWKHQRVQSHLRDNAPAAVQGSTAALIVDGVGFPKKGDHSVGVGRQWCGVSGKIDNCQMALNLTLAIPGKRYNADQVTWAMGMQLYLPKKWGGDDNSAYDSDEQRERYTRLREETGIPDEIGYRSTLISIDRNNNSAGESNTGQRWTRSQPGSSFHRVSDASNVSVSPASARR